MLRGGRPRRVQSEELGELIGNGQPRHDVDSLLDEEDESTGGSAKSQPTNSTQPRPSELVRSGSQRASRSKFSTSESAEL